MRDPQSITIVSGLPRSGTSMMMSMLQAGGMELLIDGVRTADEDNPKGYYEFELVKKIKDDQTWLDNARGKAVKLISQLVRELPTSGYRYDVIFMRRNIDEILRSQTEMLKRRGTHDPSVSDDEIRRMFIVHLDQIVTWMNQQSCIRTLFVNYNKMVKDAAPAVQQVVEFLGGDLDAAAMTAVVDRSLYRQRAT